MNASQIFDRAIQLSSVERRQYLDTVCRSDPALRKQIEAMLNDHFEARTVHTDPGARGPERAADTMDSRPPGDTPGTIVAGRYKLLEEIGEGGMGSVWLAEQLTPVKRRVAVKLVKAGMDSRQVLARFDAERQALALMDHPNIARVFDGGVTEQGRPYFVMEYVKGIPLTDYCDEARLALHERLHLFVSVCQAVQHAHQKGIIHRDLKPSNILACLYDGKPVPKVIDFGLAKAMSQPLTEHSLFTAHGIMVGTPLYMSPEQAEHNNLDVDTRTDIYSLGVILYELLTGTTPLGKQQLKQAAFNEILRLIKEVEPPKPSTRLSGSASLPAIAAQRRIEPQQLRKSLAGDLDWIVMRALEKDRNRRYETANGMARDIDRFLANEPVEACPPSAGYRLRKFVRRNRGKVFAAGAVLAALMLGFIGTTWGLIEARRQTAIARNEAIAKDAARQAEAAQREIAENEKRRAEIAENTTLADYRASTKDAIAKLIGSKEALGKMERSYLESTLARWQAYADRQEQDEHSRAIRAEGQYQVATLWLLLGRPAEAVDGLKLASQLYRALIESFPDNLEYQHNYVASLINLGTELFELERNDEARAVLSDALSTQNELVVKDPDDERTLFGLGSIHHNLGAMYSASGAIESARTEYLAAITAKKQLVERAGDNPLYQDALAHLHYNLGRMLADNGQPDQGLSEYRTAYDIQAIALKAEPELPEFIWHQANILDGMGSAYGKLGQTNDALRALVSAKQIYANLVALYPSVTTYRTGLADSWSSLAEILEQRHEYEKGIAAVQSAIGIRTALVKELPDAAMHQEVLGSHYHFLAGLLTKLNRTDPAAATYQTAIEIRKQLVEKYPQVAQYWKSLASSYFRNANLLADNNRNEDAATAYRNAIANQKRLVDLGPANLDSQHNLAIYHVRFGLLLKRMQQLESSRTENQAAIDIEKRLLESSPTNVSFRNVLGGVYCNQGLTLAAESDWQGSLPWFEQAVQTLESARQFDRENSENRDFLRNSYQSQAQALTRLKRFSDALAVWDKCLTVCHDLQRPKVEAYRAYAQVASGSIADGIAAADRLCQATNWVGDDWYDFACIYSLASAGPAEKKADFGDRAMEFLEKAISAGWNNSNDLAEDPDLDPLRDRDDFKRLIEDLKSDSASNDQ